MTALTALGATPLPVPVYAWQLPLDTRPLEAAVAGLVEGRTDVIVFTSGHQIVHLFRIAETLGLAEPLTRALSERVVIASVGPVTSEVLAEHRLTADLEPVHPKMGQLAFDLAERGPELVQRKRERTNTPSP
jgi:uroporphyrinogen-III synthase